jgi:hypothetical protein
VTQSTVAPDVSSDREPPRRSPRWRWIVAAVATIVIVGVGVVVALFVVREDPAAKPVGEAIDEFRQENQVPAPTSDILRPEAGVYEATGDGREAISFPPVSQNDGTTMPVTVQHEPDGCWTLEIDYNEAHWQTWNYCPGDATGRVVERGGQTYQRWDLGAASVENTSTFVCDPPSVVFAPDDAAGATWQQSCEGTNTQTSGSTTSAGPYTFAGDELLLIGGEEVSTRHYRQVRAISGSQIGSQTAEIWIAIETGLPVRSTRSIQIDSSSPVGTITYTENGSWQLTSLRPTT